MLLILALIVGTALNQNYAINVQNGYDPGYCSESNRGEQKLIRDREGNDRIFICSRFNNRYIWQHVDGSSTFGEFVNPGFDCTDILNNNANAEDGFYWINLNEALPRQVWCDMTTDGGGFTLIAHKTTPVTWTVPSNYTPVDPFTSHQWSSALGNASIMDFRVQLSTSNNFANTKAHWSYRLSNKRPLKELMILGKGGCDSSSPGIGDVAFVKDLMTEKIVTHSFRCSKFGIAHTSKSKIGWTMMNSCLKKPCKKGFAFLDGVPLQLDHSGAFSYSTSGSTSGINHQATAFIGCDRGNCCGCFGPVGGTGHYCTQKCNAINGGTVVKNVYSWFWIRSSLPKRVWRRCMEYRTYKNGRYEWFKLIGDSTNPVMGRCPQKEPKVNDGVVVVPDGNALNTLPRIPGLLAFTEYYNRLYLRDRFTWTGVPKQQEVSNVNSRVSQLNSRFSQLNSRVSQLNSRVAQMDTRIQEVQGETFAIRLRGGSNARGRVEVYHPRYGWGTVCDDYWDINDGHVACRQLGFSRATATYQSARYGQGSGLILLDNLLCVGSESHLMNCPHNGWNVDDCSHSEDASVDCA